MLNKVEPPFNAMQDNPLVYGQWRSVGSGAHINSFKTNRVNAINDHILASSGFISLEIYHSSTSIQMAL